MKRKSSIFSGFWIAAGTATALAAAGCASSEDPPPEPSVEPAPDAGPREAAQRPLSLRPVDEASYRRLVEAGTAAEIFRDASRGPRPLRWVAVAALLGAFAERNVRATPQQLAAYTSAIDAHLTAVRPNDPTLARAASFLPAVRFASEQVEAPELVGLDLRVGAEALVLLGVEIDTTSRASRAIGMQRAQAMNFSYRSEFARLVTSLMFDRTPGGFHREGLGAALTSLAAAHDVELLPADLAATHPEIARAQAALPESFEAYVAAEQGGFDELRSTVNAELGVIAARIDEAMLAIADEVRAAPQPFDVAPGASTEQAIEDAMRDAASRRQRRTESRALLSLTTLMIAQSEDARDETFARHAQQFGDAQLETDRTLSDIRTGLQVSGVLLTAAAAIATGPVGGVGAMLFVVDTVLGLADSTATPDQQIFEEIVALRRQVEQLRVEMHERFDSIDRQLELIYRAMSSGLNEINETTRRIDSNVQRLQLDLHRLRSQLNGIEANLYGVLSDGFEQSFVDDMETALGHRRRTGIDLEFTGDGGNNFVAFYSRFYARATSVATSEVYAGPAAQSLVDDHTAAERLTAFPLGYHINDLVRFPAALGQPPLAFGRVANPTTWSFAADAFAQLARENPWYFARLYQGEPSRLDDVIATGESARAVMRAARSRDLIEGLLDRYLERVEALDQHLDLGAFLAAEGYGHGLEPFDGVDQDLVGVGPPVTGIYDGTQFRSVWFDPTLIWEALDPRIGLAVALGLEGFEVQTSGRDTMASCRSRRMAQANVDDVCGLQRLTYAYGARPEDPDWVQLKMTRPCPEVVGTNRVCRQDYTYDAVAHFDFVDAPPSNPANWARRGDVIEALFRVQIGQPTEIGGVTFVVRSRTRLELSPASNWIPAYPSVAELEAALQGVRDAYWDTIDERLEGAVAAELADGLASSEALLEAYVALGMPQTLEQDDLVRAALRGSGSVESGLGGAWVLESFAAASSANAPPPAMREQLELRAAALLDHLGPALDAADDQPHAYLEWSLASLEDLARSVLRLAADDTYSVSVGGRLQVDAARGVSINDVPAPTGASVGVRVVEAPANGSLQLDADGAFVYVPQAGFTGTDRFRYAATADLSAVGAGPNTVTSAPATVVIDVR